MTINVSISEHKNQEQELTIAQFSGDSILAIRQFVNTVQGDWMDQSIEQAKEEISPDYRVFSMEAKQEIDKAREYLKTTFPIRYRVNRYLFNPVRAIYKLWQQR